MDINVVKTVFKVILSVDDTALYEDFIDTAVTAVTARIRSGTDSSDRRLCCVAAALAAVYAIEKDECEGKYLFVSGGKIPENEGSYRLHSAIKLYNQMVSACADLINDDGFIFISAKG